MLVYLLLAIDVLAAVTGHMLIKKGAMSLKQLEISLTAPIAVVLEVIKNYYLLLGLISYGFSFVLWILIISKMKLNVAYPVSVGLNIVLVSLGALIFYHESMSVLQIIGVVIIILGIFMILSTS